MKWVFAAVIAITLAVVGYLATAEAVAALLFGWLSFLGRVVPQVRVYWPSVILGTAAFVAFTIGLHLFLRQFTPRSIAASNAQPAPERWRFRWTTAIVAMVVVAFAAGISLVGIVHQVGWLANSEAPLTGETITGWLADDTPSSLKFVHLGVRNSTNVNGGRLPVSATLSPNGQPLHGWETAILPYTTIMTRDIDKTRPWNDVVNQKYFKCIIPFFINTAFRAPALEDDEGYGLNHFSASSRLFTPEQSIHLDEIEDGASNTILLGEVNADFSPWGRPGNVRDPAAGINRGPQTFGGPPNRRGAYFSMADGSARLIADDVDPEVLKALSAPNDADATPAGTSPTARQ
jgi:hypothetical protein